MPQALCQSLCKAQCDPRARLWMQVQDLRKVRLKEADQFRFLANDRRGGPRRVQQQGHLAKKVAALELSQKQGARGAVTHQDVDAARLDNKHPCTGITFSKDCLTGVVSTT